MAATSLGITGNWGITADETGLIITDLAWEYSHEEKTVLDKTGEVIGLSFYRPKADVKMSGLVAKTSAFSTKIGVALTLANTMPAHLPASGGTTVLQQVTRSLSNEDFEKIDIAATHYPAVASGA